jgi:DNA polymerase-3 subunit beta
VGPDDELLTISAFGRVVGLTPSALRFYDDCDLLRPAQVDPSSGYRRYTRTQVPRAVLLRRLREAELPLVEVRVVLDGPSDEAARVLTAHLRALEARLGPARRATAAALATLAGTSSRWEVTISGPELASAARQVAPAAATTDLIPALACVLIDCSDDEVILVASDRYRLAMRALGTRRSDGIPRRLLVPAADLAKIAQLAARHQEVHITASEDGANVDLGGEAHPLTLVAAEFPDYQAILSGLTPPATRAIVERAGLRDLLVNGQLPSVVAIVIGHDEVRVRAAGCPDVLFDAICTGEPMQVGFAPRVFGAALDASVGADVMLEVSGPDRAVIIRSADQGTFTTLAMPTLLAAPDAA